MNPRGGRSFCPGVASLIGSDILEVRRLLNASAGLVAGRGEAVIERDSTAIPSRSAIDRPSSEPEATATAAIVAPPVDPQDAADPVSAIDPVRGDLAPATAASDIGVPDESPVAAPGDPSEAGAAGVIGTTAGIGGAQAPAVAAVDVPRGLQTPSTARSEGRPVDGASSRPANVVPGIGEVGGEDGALLLDIGGVAVPTPIRWVANGVAGGPPSESDGEASTRTETDEPPLPRPTAADLITEFLPFDRAALDAAIDRFAAPLEDLGSELAGWSPRLDLLSGTSLLLATTLAVEVARRRLRDGGTTGAPEDADDQLVSVQGQPMSWGLGES